MQSLWSIISSLSRYPLFHSTFLCFPSAEFCLNWFQSIVFISLLPQFLGLVYFSRYSASPHALTLHQIYMLSLFSCPISSVPSPIFYPVLVFPGPSTNLISQLLSASGHLIPAQTLPPVAFLFILPFLASRSSD